MGYSMNRKILNGGYKELRERLIEARHEAGLTQTQLAKLLRKPQSFVSKYELGKRRLDVIEFVMVARALDIEPGRTVMHVDMHMPDSKRGK
jgi:transcriptional regulator with XRE-family HTH domain